MCASAETCGRRRHCGTARTTVAGSATARATSIRTTTRPDSTSTTCRMNSRAAPTTNRQEAAKKSTKVRLALRASHNDFRGRVLFVAVATKSGKARLGGETVHSVGAAADSLRGHPAELVAERFVCRGRTLDVVLDAPELEVAAVPAQRVCRPHVA